MAHHYSLELEGQSSEHNHLTLNGSCMIKVKTMVELGGPPNYWYILSIVSNVLIHIEYIIIIIHGWDKEFLNTNECNWYLGHVLGGGGGVGWWGGGGGGGGD